MPALHIWRWWHHLFSVAGVYSLSGATNSANRWHRKPALLYVALLLTLSKQWKQSKKHSHTGPSIWRRTIFEYFSGELVRLVDPLLRGSSGVCFLLQFCFYCLLLSRTGPSLCCPTWDIVVFKTIQCNFLWVGFKNSDHKTTAWLLESCFLYYYSLRTENTTQRIQPPPSRKNSYYNLIFQSSVAHSHVSGWPGCPHPPRSQTPRWCFIKIINFAVSLTWLKSSRTRAFLFSKLLSIFRPDTGSSCHPGAFNRKQLRHRK